MKLLQLNLFIYFLLFSFNQPLTVLSRIPKEPKIKLQENEISKSGKSWNDVQDGNRQKSDRKKFWNVYKRNFENISRHVLEDINRTSINGYSIMNYLLSNTSNSNREQTRSISDSLSSFNEGTLTTRVEQICENCSLTEMNEPTTSLIIENSLLRTGQIVSTSNYSKDEDLKLPSIETSSRRNLIDQSSTVINNLRISSTITSTTVPELQISKIDKDFNAKATLSPPLDGTNWLIESTSLYQRENISEITASNSLQTVITTEKNTSALFSPTIASSFLLTSFHFPEKSSTDIDKSSTISEVLTAILTSTQRDISFNDTIANPETDQTSSSNCHFLPSCVIVTLSMPWFEFCSNEKYFRQYLAQLLSECLKPKVIVSSQIILFHDSNRCQRNSTLTRRRRQSTIVIVLYVVDKKGHFDATLTSVAGVVLKKVPESQKKVFHDKVLTVELFYNEVSKTKEGRVIAVPNRSGGIVAAITVSAVAAVCLFLLCILLGIMKQRLNHARRSQSPLDVFDMGSLSASQKRRRARLSLRSFINQAFEHNEIPSRPLNETELENACKNRTTLEEEFKLVPMNMPRVDHIPSGVEAKNRYANVIPISGTRVHLNILPGLPNSDYINANYVRGYKGKARRYIASQGPLPETVEDFWRMIWEQETRVIIMLTKLEENDISRCAAYFPEDTINHSKLCGDYQIALQKKDIREDFVISTFRFNDLEKNLFRDITHLWYIKWPLNGVPENTEGFLKFLLHARPFIDCNTGPTVVHCSPGTGRTGVFLTIDICISEYEDTKKMDVLRNLYNLREDRGGMVQTVEQYYFIYEILNLHVTRNDSQSLSRQSSLCLHI